LGERRSSTTRKLILILTNLASLGCLVWTLRDAHLSELRDDLARMQWGWIALAVVADIAVYFWHGLRWMLLLRPVVSVGIGKPVRAIYVGLFANEILPFRVGELLRCFLMSRWTALPFSVCLSSALIERVFDGMWLGGCLIVVLQMIELPGRVGNIVEDAGYALGFLVLGLGAVLAIGLFHRQKAHAALEGHRWRKRFAILMDDLAIMGHSRYLVIAMAQSVPYLLLQVIPIWAAAKGYPGFDLTLGAAFVVMVIVRLGTSVPSAPGNLGLFQFLTKEILDHVFHIPVAEAARFSLVLWGIVTMPLLIAGFVALLVSEANLNELQRSAREEASGLEARNNSRT